MNKLTAEKCREFIRVFKALEREGHLALTSEYHLQALEIALPVLEQQESADLISTPQHVLDEKFNEHFGAPPHPTTDTTPQIDNDGWIEWGGGKCPVKANALVDYRTRAGNTADTIALALRWAHEGWDGDIIAYRVIEQQERERGDEA